MTRNPFARLLAFALLLLPASPMAAAPQEKSAAMQDMRYDIRFMDLHAAEVLAWDQCSQKEHCRIGTMAVSGDPARRGYLEVRADAATQEKVARALAKADGAPFTQSFQVLLLAASTKAEDGGPEIPANVQKALADLKGFLPFKSYRLLDAVWMRATQDRLTEGHAVTGRDGPDYRVRLRFRTVGAPQERSLFVDGFSLMEEPGAPKPPAAGEKPGEAVTPRPSRAVIDTSFGLKEGETIVVGTSKVDGADEALVVLLTAVPAP
jgi:hypothetical protein